MIAPTPTINQYKSGDLTVVNWHAAWTDSTALTDSIVVDLSADLPSGAVGVEILKIYAEISPGIQFKLEFDATTDDFICASALGATQMYRDFRFKGRSAVRDPKSTGTTGDVVLTSTSMASGDHISLTIICRMK